MSERLREVVERLGLLLRAEERRAAAELGIQPVQLQVLVYLDRCNRFSDHPAAVAEYLGATKGTISQSIQRLQEKGLIEANRDEVDRRRIHLTLTTAGKALVKSAATVDRLGRALAGLGRRGNAKAILESLVDAVQSAQEQPAFGTCESCCYLDRKGRRPTCTLFDETLNKSDLGRICREHDR
ncbi:MAG: winged helix-turn-helix transcriptional regulator [Planctomycetes bacterium]|nr:winged helix-turn-helix transcriptional regulator [Planctomycetota bacterium]